MARIFWDTNLFIYLFEQNPLFAPRVAEIRTRMLERSDTLVTSALTVGEILVKPVELGNNTLVERYRHFFRSPAVTVIPFDQNAGEAYARIRMDRSIKRPDAIQLACAATAEVDLLITNDDRLSRKHVPGVHFVTGLAKAPI